MYWVSPAKHYFRNLADAAIDTVGWAWQAFELGGMPVFKLLVARAAKEAGKLAHALEQQEWEEEDDYFDGVRP
jgi:glycogen debranching enzyme